MFVTAILWTALFIINFNVAMMNTLGKPGRRALAGSRRHFFFFAVFSALSDFLALSGLLSAFFADFFGSTSFFLSFFSGDSKEPRPQPLSWPVMTFYPSIPCWLSKRRLCFSCRL